jgi:hypothetical protein
MLVLAITSACYLHMLCDVYLDARSRQMFASLGPDASADDPLLPQGASDESLAKSLETAGIHGEDPIEKKVTTAYDGGPN